MEIEGITAMRNLLVTAVLTLIVTAACGGGSESDAAAEPELPDSTGIVEIVNSIPNDAPSGAYNLIDEAQSVTDQANERTEQLEQLIGDE